MRAVLLCAVATCLSVQAQVRILVAYHSETGNTEALAKSVRDGAASVKGVEVTLRKMGDVKAEEIASADGVLIGTPVYWQNVSTETKRFLDRMGDVLSKRGKELGEGRTAGVFCTAGEEASGKDLTRMQTIAAFLAMRLVAIGGVDEGGYGTLGAQATTGGANPGVSDKGRAEARRFGERFARLTKQFHAGAAR